MKELFLLRTVRRKIVMVSKAAGTILVVSYVAATRLPLGEELSLILWVFLTILLVLVIDYLLKRFISDPVSDICSSAERIARLDFSGRCEVASEDEFGELAGHLNRMSEELQNTLLELGQMNLQLERDIEKERRLLDERKELTDRLSHEMKTPLGVIRAYAEGIQDETDADRVQGYAKVIIAETGRMSTLITTLLDLSALESGAATLAPERIGFVELAETVAGRLLADQPDARFALQYELPEQEICVYTDPQRMEQVLNNLIVNAKKNVVTDGVIRLSLVRQGGCLRCSVYNQGSRIPEEALPHIWEKFYRDRHADYGGSGLGLAIVAQVLSMQNIAYGVENQPDGVEFFFLIPMDE